MNPDFTPTDGDVAEAKADITRYTGGLMPDTIATLRMAERGFELCTLAEIYVESGGEAGGEALARVARRVRALEAARAAAESDGSLATSPGPAPGAGATRAAAIDAIAGGVATLAETGADVEGAIAEGLQEAALRLGSVEALLTRPGSWESAHVEALAGPARYELEEGAAKG